MHPFSILTLAIFVAGYITARWDLVTRLYELAIFAIDHGVLVCLPEKTMVTSWLMSISSDTDPEGLCHTLTGISPIHPASRTCSC